MTDKNNYTSIIWIAFIKDEMYAFNTNFNFKNMKGIMLYWYLILSLALVPSLRPYLSEGHVWCTEYDIFLRKSKVPWGSRWQNTLNSFFQCILTKCSVHMPSECDSWIVIATLNKSQKWIMTLKYSCKRKDY